MLKKILAPMTVAGVLLVGVASTGVASATPSKSPAVAARPHAGKHHGLRQWLGAHRHQVASAVITISSQTIGISSQTLVTELRSGKSIAEVATENNVAAQTVSDALVNAADAKIAQAVTNNKLTAAQASKIEAEVPGYVTKLVNHVF